MRHPLHSAIQLYTRVALHAIAAFTAVSVVGMAAVTLLRAVAAHPGPWTAGVIILGAVGTVIFAACSGERGAR